MQYIIKMIMQYESTLVFYTCLCIVKKYNFFNL